ncbi:hypothetical protein AOR_1_1262014 [Paecilomyces variotii No. 5]|uniref:Uncharacterized protein n=1 Tax=Byssochlamys spectabilis (strain No. 5 / NBRC 109023) TaxID=1356009 RepID=V5HWD1_BYSSN|nr:hypothetical protein AOR_1_1262014 [Paecilomyces variotii No. 5]
MAIWPFGRKGRRSSAQLAGPETVEKMYAAQEPESILAPPQEAAISPKRKPSRKKSKRRKNRASATPDESSIVEQDAPSPPRRAKSTPQTRFVEPNHPPMKTNTEPVGQRPYGLEQASHSSIGQDQLSVSRTGSVLRRPSSTGPAVLKKRLSKRKIEQISREQEIRAMSSSPMNIPRRAGASNTVSSSWDTRRVGSVISRSDRHASDLSLPARDSPGSSMTDGSESYTFKVNPFAAWTPRPAIRYSEPPRYEVPRSQGPSVASNKHSTIPEESLNPKKRIDELADDLDAGALRELLERDRRRKEKKRIEDQERLQRRLQRRAERQQAQERRREEQYRHQEAHEQGKDDRRGRSMLDSTIAPVSAERGEYDSGAKARSSSQQSGSWLRDPSKDGRLPKSNRASRASLESVHVIGNLDDSSIRAKKTAQRDSVALSQDMQVSRSSISPCPSPIGKDASGTSMSQHPGFSSESISDRSRTIDQERRSSDNSGKRMNGWSTFFRRGSSRLKRGSWDRIQRPPSEFSNTSRESFSRIPPSVVESSPGMAQRSFLRVGTVKRSQSKFTEHLGDFPMSPPESRLQSPDIPETIPDMPSPEQAAFHDDLEQTIGRPIPGRSADRHRSWESGVEPRPDSALLSRSLASVDSEGSWMSGKFLRRISQHTNSPVRRSVASSGNKLEGYAESREVDDIVGDEDLARLTPSHEEYRNSLAGARRASSSAMGADSDGESDSLPMQRPEPEGEPEETWHHIGIGRRPTVIRPSNRPKSKSGLLNHVQTVPTVPTAQSAEIVSVSGDNSPVDEEAEIQRATSVDYGRGHARHVSAGSAKLLDIPPRASMDSKPLSSEAEAHLDSTESRF